MLEICRGPTHSRQKSSFFFIKALAYIDAVVQSLYRRCIAVVSPFDETLYRRSPTKQRRAAFHHSKMRCSLVLLILPGMAATDNAICAVMEPLMDGLDSLPGMSCSCEGDGTLSNIGGDAECALEIAPPDVDALKSMITSSYFLKLDLGTTVRPCEMPAMAELAGGLYLPQLSSETADSALDTALSAAIDGLSPTETEDASPPPAGSISASLSSRASLPTFRAPSSFRAFFLPRRSYAVFWWPLTPQLQ